MTFSLPTTVDYLATVRVTVADANGQTATEDVKLNGANNNQTMRLELAAEQPVNTTPIYLMGSGNGLSWETFPGMEVLPGEDGSYNFTIENLSSFKMSTKKAAGWDGDFNDEAFGYNGAFGDAVFNAEGMTVALEPWGENQDMPYPGSYTININDTRSSMTVKANFEKPTVAPDVFIRGAMNGWNPPFADTWKFENVSWDGNSGTWTWTGTINPNQEFKIADANWGNINYSTNGAVTVFNQPITVSYNGGNSKFNETFVGTITLTVTNYTGHQATATFAPEGEASFPETMYVFGNVNGKGISPDNGVAMTVTDQDNGIYTIENVLVGNEMDSGYGYIGFAEKLSTSSSDWSTLNAYRFGPATADEPIEATGDYTVTFTDYNSFKVPADNYLTMTLDVKNMKLTVTAMTTEEPEQPSIPEGAYVVYNNGAVNQDLKVYGWWAAGINFTAANPNGAGETFEFKADNGGAAASMGINMEAPQNTGILHNATLNFNWYATTTATYTVRLTSVAEENYQWTVTEDQIGKWNTVSLNVAETFPTVAAQWDANTNLGVGYVFSIIMDNGTEDSAIYFDQIYYTNVDNEWEAPVVVIPAPETVPTPAQAADDVFSFFSSYGDNVSNNIGGWGQSTQLQTVEIDGKDVYFLRNFNYLGLVDFNINVADYDYMHVDYWTNSENTPFGFVPISLNPTVDTPIWEAPEVKANEWNSYDAPLAGFNADMSKIEQLKFVANLNDNPNTEFAYIANIYFWKETKEQPGELSGTGNMTYQTDMNMGMTDEPELTEPETEEVEVSYADGKLAFATFGPGSGAITFDVDVTTGGATATDVVSYTDEDFTYYYADIESRTTVVYATLYNIEGADFTTMEVKPWGEYLTDYDFFNGAFYNTVIELPFLIEGLPTQTPEEPDGWTKVTQDGNDFYYQFEYQIMENFYGEGTLTLWGNYKWKDDKAPVGTAADNSAYIFVTGTGINGVLELDGNHTATTNAEDHKYVEGEECTFNFVCPYSGNQLIETVNYTVKGSSSVDAIGAEEGEVIYFNLQGVRVENPTTGVYIRVANGKATKVAIR